MYSHNQFQSENVQIYVLYMFMFMGNTHNKQTNHQVGYMSSNVGVPFPVGLI